MKLFVILIRWENEDNLLKYAFVNIIVSNHLVDMKISFLYQYSSYLNQSSVCWKKSKQLEARIWLRLAYSQEKRVDGR